MKSHGWLKKLISIFVAVAMLQSPSMAGANTGSTDMLTEGDQTQQTMTIKEAKEKEHIAQMKRLRGMSMKRERHPSLFEMDNMSISHSKSDEKINSFADRFRSIFAKSEDEAPEEPSDFISSRNSRLAYMGPTHFWRSFMPKGRSEDHISFSRYARGQEKMNYALERRSAVMPKIPAEPEDKEDTEADELLAMIDSNFDLNEVKEDDFTEANMNIENFDESIEMDVEIMEVDPEDIFPNDEKITRLEAMPDLTFLDFKTELPKNINSLIDEAMEDGILPAELGKYMLLNDGKTAEEFVSAVQAPAEPVDTDAGPEAPGENGHWEWQEREIEIPDREALAEIAGLLADIAVLKAEKLALQLALSFLTSDLNKINQQIADLEKRIGEREKEIEELKQKIRNIKKEIKDLETKYNNKEREFYARWDAIVAINNEVDRLRAELRSRPRPTKERREQIRNQLIILREEWQKHVNARRELRKRGFEIIRLVNQKNKELRQLNRELIRKESGLENMRKRLDRLRQRRAAEEARIAARRQAILDRIAEIDAEIAEKQKRIEELRGRTITITIRVRVWVSDPDDGGDEPPLPPLEDPENPAGGDGGNDGDTGIVNVNKFISEESVV